MHKVDRRVPLLWKPLQEAGLEQALQRGGRLGHFGHPADHCKRGALTEHRKRRRELIRILGQLGQRPIVAEANDRGAGRSCVLDVSCSGDSS
jgi:hypothetical protein